jgi:hypothetical protein
MICPSRRRGLYLTLTAAILLALVTPPTAAAAPFTFFNTTPIVIDAGPNGPFSPYPSIIDVAGLSGPIVQVTATLYAFSHTHAIGVGALLMGPGGQYTVLFNGSGGREDGAVNLTFTFDDFALSTMPSVGALQSGTYRPSNEYPTDDFDAPAPLAPYPVSLAVFNGLTGSSANGEWRLYVSDFSQTDGGSFADGWSLTVTTAAVPEPSALLLFAAGLGLVAHRGRRRVVSR